MKGLSDFPQLIAKLSQDNESIIEVMSKMCYNDHTMSGGRMEKEEKLEIQIKRLKKIREDLGMNRTEFSRYVDIPLRTLEEWEAGRRQMPDYVLRLLTYYTKVERLLAEQKIELNIQPEIKVFESEHFNKASKER